MDAHDEKVFEAVARNHGSMNSSGKLRLKNVQSNVTRE